MSETMFLPPFPVAAIVAAAIVLLALAAVRALRERSLAAFACRRSASVACPIELAGMPMIARSTTRLRVRSRIGAPGESLRDHGGSGEHRPRTGAWARDVGGGRPA